MKYEIVEKVKQALAGINKPLPASRIALKAGVTTMQAAQAFRQLGAVRELNVKKGIFYYEPSLRVTGPPYEIKELATPATTLPSGADVGVNASFDKGSVLVLNDKGHYVPAKFVSISFLGAE
jgi:hypothetical protein